MFGSVFSALPFGFSNCLRSWNKALIFRSFVKGGRSLNSVQQQALLQNLNAATTTTKEKVIYDC